VLTILLSLAVPSFNNIIRDNRVTTKTNDFVTALSLAKSEAIRSGVQVDVIANSGAWNNGWNVQINGGAVLRQFEAPTGSIAIAGDTATISFSASGLPTDFATTAIHNFTVCDSGKFGRQIRIATGRPNIASKTPC
jgi:type IV fimbrial biogenesis protein FimT